MSLPPDDPTAPGFSYETSKSLYLFTSLTAGSSHIITATSRLEGILKANRVPFKAVDTATDEKARRIWGRRSQGKKLPGLVREGLVLADLIQVEEWNEYGELREQLGLSAATAPGPVPPASTAAAQANKTQAGHQMELPIREAPHSSTQTTASATSGAAQPSVHQSLAAEAAALAKQRKQEKLGLSSPSAPKATAEKEENAVEARPSATSPPIKREESTTNPLDEPSTHNTSTSAALPALPSHLSPSSSPPTQSSILATPAASKDVNTAPFASAGPASKSGLEAVTDDPAVAATISVEDGETDRRQKGGTMSPANKRGSFTKEASLEEIAAVESGAVIPEDPREEEEAAKSKDEDNKGLRVKFQEDSLKGAANDGNAAVESVGD